MSHNQDIEQRIRRLEDQRFQAMMDADTETLDQVLADELSYVHTSAALDSKRSLIDALASGALKYNSISSHDATVRVYGETAVGTGNGDVTVTANNQQLSFALRFTDVYARRDGRWQMVAWQATRLPEE